MLKQPINQSKRYASTKSPERASINKEVVRMMHYIRGFLTHIRWELAVSLEGMDHSVCSQLWIESEDYWLLPIRIVGKEQLDLVSPNFLPRNLRKGYLFNAGKVAEHSGLKSHINKKMILV